MTGGEGDWGLSNPGPRKLVIWLEPWAEEFEVPIGSTITLSFSSEMDDCGPSDLDVTADHVVVWATAGQTVRVFINDDLQDSASASTPVPGGFNGSTRELLNILFKDMPGARLGGAERPAATPTVLVAKSESFLGL